MLAQLPHWAFAVALLIARVGCACMLLPGVGEAELPGTLRAGFVLALVAVLLAGLAPDVPALPGDVARLAGMIGAEIVTGLWLGWLSRLVLLALPMAGQIISSVTGLTNVLQPDPTLGPQTAALSRALGLVAPVLVLATGLYRLPIAALAGSYRVIPPGTPLPAADTAAQVTAAVGAAFALALRLAAPFVLAGIVWHVGMGLLARLVPRLQIFFAAAPGQILGGIALLGLLGTTLLTAWHTTARAVLSALPGL